jgi:hypothetical protein
MRNCKNIIMTWFSCVSLGEFSFDVMDEKLFVMIPLQNVAQFRSECDLIPNQSYENPMTLLISRQIATQALENYV